MANEYLEKIYKSIGGSVNDLPDNLKSTLYKAIILKCGGTVDDLPDGLETTYLKRIFELVQGGSGGSYEQGVKDERERFWLSSVIGFEYPASMWENSYRFAGKGWNDETFKPTIDMAFHSQCQCMFNVSNITDIVSSLEECGVTFTIKNLTGSYAMYAYSETRRTLPMSILKTDFIATFSYCPNLVSIGKITLQSDGQDTWLNTFIDSPNIENIEFEGVIGQNGFNVQWSTKLTKASLLNILNCLKDYSQDTSGTDWLVTIGSTNKAKLTAEELAIAENKGWRVV